MRAELLLYHCAGLSAWITVGQCERNRGRGGRGVGFEDVLACHGCAGVRVLSDRNGEPPRRVPIRTRPKPPPQPCPDELTPPSDMDLAVLGRGRRARIRTNLGQAMRRRMAGRKAAW